MTENNLTPYAENNSLVDLFSKEAIIKDTDLSNLASCKDFIVDTFLTVPMYRTLPIKLFGVLSDDKFPTPESKFWQCKVEAEVHANELVRDIHNLEDMKINLEKSEYILTNSLLPKQELEQDQKIKAEMEFDVRKLKVSISRQRFEYFQLQKRIKYRIEEVTEWKQISDKLTQNFDVKNSNYARILVEALKTKWTNELKDEKLDPKMRKATEVKLNNIEQSLKIRSQSA
jgi:hypothetical protein